MRSYDIVVIGGGAAGLAAAIEAKNNGIDSILLIEKADQLGGILNQCIHTGFGLTEFKEELTGPEYAERFIEQFNNLKIEYLLNAMATKINDDKTLEFSSITGYEKIKFNALILATGCYERTAGNIRLSGDRCSGIFTAGQAQSFLNNYGYLPGKEIFILGSGDIGLIMARRLTLEGAHVIGVAEIMHYSNGLNRNIAQCLEDFNIPLYLSTTVSKVKGKRRLEEISLVNVDEKLNVIEGTEKTIKCDTLLLSVGLIPNLGITKDLNLKRNHKNLLDVYDNLETMKEGIFACGNCLHVHDLVDNVSNEARTAGFFASEYIKHKENCSEKITIIPSNDFQYVIPEYLRLGREYFELKFRSKNHLMNVKLVARQQDKIIFTKFFKFLVPSEMEIVNIPLKDIAKEDIILEIIT